MSLLLRSLRLPLKLRHRQKSREEVLAEFLVYGLATAKPARFGKLRYHTSKNKHFVLTASHKYLMVPPKHVNMDVVRVAQTIGYWLSEDPRGWGVFMKILNEKNDLLFSLKLWLRLLFRPKLRKMIKELTQYLSYPLVIDGLPQNPTSKPKRLGTYYLSDNDIVIAFFSGDYRVS